jgi:hypothetical protein
MARRRKRGEIVDLEARRAQRKQAALADDSRAMLRAEEALFELLRDAGREERGKIATARPAPRAKPPGETRELRAMPAARTGDAPEERARGRLLLFRRGRAA